MNIDFLKLFNKVIGVVFGAMLLFITLGMIIGVLHLFMSVGDLMVEKELGKHYSKIISDVLTLFILVELSRSLVEYFHTQRLRMTFIVDAGIVFVLRELMIGLFEHKIMPDEIYALSALMLVLTVLRIGSVVVYQRERRMADMAKSASSQEKAAE